MNCKGELQGDTIWWAECTLNSLNPQLCTQPPQMCHRHPELADAAGGICVTGDSGGHVSTLSLSQLAAAEPDVIVFAPCGFDLARSAKDLHEAAWRESPGVSFHSPAAALDCSQVMVSKTDAHYHLPVFTSIICYEDTLPSMPHLVGHLGQELQDYHGGGACGSSPR